MSPAQLGVAETLLPAPEHAQLTKRDMLHNDAMPEITVDPETFDVVRRRRALHLRAGRSGAAGRRYMLR